MATDSDAVIKQLIISEIGEKNNLKLRIFAESSNTDQKPWIEGGLSFGKRDLLYGSCDCVWYTENPWEDLFNHNRYNYRPIIAVEATLALERGSSGSAQYQRFFHALGAVLTGVIGVYFLRSAKNIKASKMRYDLPLAALNAWSKHKVPYLVINDLKDLKSLVEAISKNDEDNRIKILEKIKTNMKDFFKNNVPSSYKDKETNELDIHNYCKGRSIAISPAKEFIKILSTNYDNLTIPKKRGGHILLGEYFIAKYVLNRDIIVFLPRLNLSDIKKLNRTKKKEWSLLNYDSKGKIATLDSFEGIEDELKEKIKKLTGSELFHSKVKDKLMEGIESGKYKLKKDAFVENIYENL